MTQRLTIIALCLLALTIESQPMPPGFVATRAPKVFKSGDVVKGAQMLLVKPAAVMPVLPPALSINISNGLAVLTWPTN